MEDIFLYLAVNMIISAVEMFFFSSFSALSVCDFWYFRSLPRVDTWQTTDSSTFTLSHIFRSKVSTWQEWTNELQLMRSKRTPVDVCKMRSSSTLPWRNFLTVVVSTECMQCTSCKCTNRGIWFKTQRQGICHHSQAWWNPFENPAHKRQEKNAHMRAHILRSTISQCPSWVTQVKKCVRDFACFQCSNKQRSKYPSFLHKFSFKISTRMNDGLLSSEREEKEFPD